MAESDSGDHQKSSDLASLRSSLTEFSDTHDVSLTKPDIEKKIGEMSDWVERQKKSADKNSKKELIQNVDKFAKATVSGVQKLASGDTVNGSLELISSVAVFAGGAIGGPVGAAVGAIVGTICSIIGAIFTASKPRQPSIVTQLAEVVHKELVDFNNKLQDQVYNGLKRRVADQADQLRTMKRGDKLDDPNLWTDYVQFIGELSYRFESPLPFKYSKDSLTNDPDVNDFVRALMKYCQAYSCYMALLMAAKGKFADLGKKCKEYEDNVDRKIASQMKDARDKLAFLFDEKYLTFLGRIPSEGGKLTKLLVVSRNAEARHLVEMVTHVFGLPNMLDPKTVESRAEMVSRQSVILKLEGHRDPALLVEGMFIPYTAMQFINETNFPMKIVCGTAGKDVSGNTFTEAVKPRLSYDRFGISPFGYVLIYLDGKLRSDDEPHEADVTRVIEFALSNSGGKVNIQDKTGTEFTRGQDTYDKLMKDGCTNNPIYWVVNDTAYMAEAFFYEVPTFHPCKMPPEIAGFRQIWRFVVQDFDPVHDVKIFRGK